MNKFLTAAMATVIAAGSLGVADAASAQSRNDRRDHRQVQAPRHVQPQPQPQRQVQHQAQPAYGRWQQSQRRYNATRYVAPRGHAVRQWSYGQRMPAQYRDSRYVVRDYGRYGLRAPPRGYEYVRSGDDVVLAVVATGLITAVIAGLFN